MDVLSLVYFPAWIALFYGLPFLVAIVVIVFVHEFGHFIVARWCGVSIEAFSIGFGKEITGWNDRHGTRWKLAWIPLGGYVKFKGDANAASLPDGSTGKDTDPRNFHNKPVWQRAAVVAAGPFANFALTIVIFTVAFWLIGVPLVEPRVGDILPGSAAQEAGLKVGDLVLSIDGSEIDDFTDLQEAIIMRPGETVKIVVDRNGEKLTLSATPHLMEQPDNFGGKTRIGLLGVKAAVSGTVPVHRFDLHKSFDKAVQRTWFVVSATGKYIAKLVTGHESADQMGGMISAGKMAGDAARGGFFDFINAVALLSVSIGLINLFPIPMLDGGHLVYYAIEAVRGKPLGPRAQEWGMRIGFSLVIMLMVVGTWNDVVRLITMAIRG
jgi:regulator of sigma E protease